MASSSFAIAHPDDAAKAIGRRLPDDLFKFVPWGRRLIVVREPPELTYGRIIIPASVRTDQQKSVGWVISAGPDVGGPDNSGRTPAGVSPVGPEDILLRKILFGKYSGTPFLVRELEQDRVTDLYKDRDSQLLNPYVLMTDADILGELLPEVPFNNSQLTS